MKAILTLLLLINIGYCQLIQTHWHESYPYNQACPWVDSTPTYAGNRSVAVAQLLYYWQHPNVGYGEIDYANIWTDSIHCQFYQLYFPCETDQQKANLVFSAGAACKHQFSPYMQNSLCDMYNLDTIAKGLETHFGYKPGIITTDLSQICTTIATGKPVILESYPIFPQLGCARYFLLDGFNEGVFHVNNNFGGLFDGWYSIDEVQFLNVTYGTNWRCLITEPDTFNVSGYIVYDGTNEHLPGFINGIYYPEEFSITFPKGLYCPVVNITEPIRGINAVDALAIARYYAQLDTEIYQQVADVNNDSTINSIDALKVLQKFAGHPIQFYNKWHCDVPCLTEDSTIVINCRCVGDVKN